MKESVVTLQSQPDSRQGLYRRLLSNRPFMLLWGGRAVSYLGDDFFNLAVMWVIYTASGSALQTALIQVVWHLSSILFGPFAGVAADRFDRKRIMVLTNLLSAVVVSSVAAILYFQGAISPAIVLSSVFILNSITMFFAPANFSMMPEVVERDTLATASGMFSTARQVATLIGGPLAGVVIATVGSVWAVIVNALSFLFAGLCVAVASLPKRAQPATGAQLRQPFWRDIVDGWRAISGHPVIRTLVWLGLLLNVASFIGPLWPALIDQRLHRGAEAYGTIQAVGVVGALVAGALAGALERRVGAGYLAIIGWGLTGICRLGIAASTSFMVTAALMFISTFWMVVAGIALGALTQILCPENYRGRLSGIASGLSVLAIPPSALLGGWMADTFGVAAMFAAAGLWTLGVAVLMAAQRHVRTARI